MNPADQTNTTCTQMKKVHQELLQFSQNKETDIIEEIISSITNNVVCNISKQQGMLCTDKINTQQKCGNCYQSNHTKNSKPDEQEEVATDEIDKVDTTTPYYNCSIL